jgi:adenine phosphoribosyltransferase
MRELNASDKRYILESIRNVPDYPKPGIQFKDITTLLNNAKVFNFLMDHLTARYEDMKLDYIAGIESRGFIFGAALAARLRSRFVPIRKPGKLPYTTISEKYSLEYGVDEVELHIDAFQSEIDNPRVLLIDDLIATGGTANAAVSLINKAGAQCVEACFIINLTALQGDLLIQKSTPVYSVLEID